MSRCIEPKAPTGVNKTLAAPPLTIAEKCRSPGSCGVWRDLGRSIHRAESSSVHVPNDKTKPDHPVIMQSDLSALEVRGLTKRFDRAAVDALDLIIRTGEFYALLGPNGAGKTTTLRMVAGLLKPDAGSVSILGIDALNDPVAAKQITAWVSDEPMIYDKLTPLEYLAFVAGLWGSIPGRPNPRRASFWFRWVSSRICTNAARDFPR